MYRLDSVQIGYTVTDTDTGKSIYYQSDWDYPRLVADFGGCVTCECGETDGTVDCPHTTASDMITAADNWLFDNDGLEVNGVGTFDDLPLDMWG